MRAPRKKITPGKKEERQRARAMRPRRPYTQEDLRAGLKLMLGEERLSSGKLGGREDRLSIAVVLDTHPHVCPAAQCRWDRRM